MSAVEAARFTVVLMSRSAKAVMDSPGELHLAIGTAPVSQGVFVGANLVGARLVWLAGAWGVHQRHPLGNFVSWFFLIGPAGLVNFIAHVTFSLFEEGAYRALRRCGFLPRRVSSSSTG